MSSLVFCLSVLHENNPDKFQYGAHKQNACVLPIEICLDRSHEALMIFVNNMK